MGITIAIGSLTNAAQGRQNTPTGAQHQSTLQYLLLQESTPEETPKPILTTHAPNVLHHQHLTHQKLHVEFRTQQYRRTAYILHSRVQALQ